MITKDELVGILCVKAAQVEAKGQPAASCVPLASSNPDFLIAAEGGQNEVGACAGSFDTLVDDKGNIEGPHRVFGVFIYRFNMDFHPLATFFSN